MEGVILEEAVLRGWGGRGNVRGAMLVGEGLL